MKKIHVWMACFLSLSIGLVSCEDYFFMENRIDTGSCQMSNIGSVIVGTWTFNSDYGPGKVGKVTFKADRTFSDPDSLFEKRLDVGPVTSRTYDPLLATNMTNVPGYRFGATLRTNSPSYQIIYLKVTEITCNRVVLTAPNGPPYRITLTR